MTVKELVEEYEMLNIIFIEWKRDFGFDYKVRCTEFSESDDTCITNCDHLSWVNKKMNLSQLVEMINSGEIEIIGGRKINKD